MMEITEAHYEEYQERGFVILRRYLPEEVRAEAAAALRRCIKPWDEVKDSPPPDRTAFHGFPYPEAILNRLTIEPGIVKFARRVLGTDDIHFRAGLSIARYPGFIGDFGEPHIDNGNNSLLPPTEFGLGYEQMTCWWHLEDVEEDQAPLRIIPKMYGKDESKYESVIVPGGTICIFNNYLWHSAGNYERADGQRYSWGYMFGRAEHYWEGFKHYTHVGRDPHFQQLIGSLTPKERELFRFPPVGHPYYTPQTLAALEKQYPGWDAADYL
jgi:hypothetical protein